ncbi:MAG: hypothetical protein JJU16_00840 [Alkalibacterium sp.]|nr:hypothetical protein [Alkalibacterium sp.]
MVLLNLVKLQLLTVVDHKKRLAYVGFFCVVFIGFHFYRFISFLTIENLSGTGLEALFYTLGGIQGPVKAFHILSSLVLITSPILFVQIAREHYEDLEMLVLNRSEDRKKWWTSLVLSNLILSFVFTVFLVTIVVIFSLLFFEQFQLSYYGTEFYSGWADLNLSPLSSLFILWLNLCIGVTLLLNLLSLLQLISHRKTDVFVAYLIFISSTIFIGGFESIPDFFLIGLYPTVLNMTPSINEIIGSILIKLVLVSIIWLLGRIFSIKIIAS